MLSVHYQIVRVLLVAAIVEQRAMIEIKGYARYYWEAEN
jgi:hypothetical protein